MDNPNFVYVVCWQIGDEAGTMAVFVNEDQAGRLASEMNRYNPAVRYYVETTHFISTP